MINIFSNLSAYFFAAQLVAVIMFTPVSHADVSARKVTMYSIQINIEDAVIIATLDDNPTTRDLITRLPIRVLLKDYAATEKIAFLPDKLTSQGGTGSTPLVGDISYYAPWGNLAMFYKSYTFSSELIRLGQIVSGIEHLHFSGEKPVTISLINLNEVMRKQQ